MSEVQIFLYSFPLQYPFAGRTPGVLIVQVFFPRKTFLPFPEDTPSLAKSKSLPPLPFASISNLFFQFTAPPSLLLRSFPYEEFETPFPPRRLSCLTLRLPVLPTTKASSKEFQQISFSRPPVSLPNILQSRGNWRGDALPRLSFQTPS